MPHTCKRHLADEYRHARAKRRRQDNGNGAAADHARSRSKSGGGKEDFDKKLKNLRRRSSEHSTSRSSGTALSVFCRCLVSDMFTVYRHIDVLSAHAVNVCVGQVMIRSRFSLQAIIECMPFSVRQTFLESSDNACS